MVGWCSMGTFNDQCFSLKPIHWFLVPPPTASNLASSGWLQTQAIAEHLGTNKNGPTKSQKVIFFLDGDLDKYPKMILYTCIYIYIIMHIYMYVCIYIYNPPFHVFEWWRRSAEIFLMTWLVDKIEAQLELRHYNTKCEAEKSKIFGRFGVRLAKWKKH